MQLACSCPTPQHEGGSIAIPTDDNLLLQLTEYKWQQPRGRIQLEPKDELKKRIKSSPDEADACMYALAEVEWRQKSKPGMWMPSVGFRESGYRL